MISESDFSKIWVWCAAELWKGRTSYFQILKSVDKSKRFQVVAQAKLIWDFVLMGFRGADLHASSHLWLPEWPRSLEWLLAEMEVLSACRIENQRTYNPMSWPTINQFMKQGWRTNSAPRKAPGSGIRNPTWSGPITQPASTLKI